MSLGAFATALPELPLVNFLNRMVRDSGLAEDLAQEVFMRVYRARKDYEPNAKFTTWLFRIATNLALNSLRDGRHRQMEISIDQKSDDGEHEQVRLDVADRTPNIEHRLLARDRAAVIRNAVESLPEKQRAAVLLQSMLNWTTRKLHGHWNVPESALKSYYCFRAYETLRVQLAPLVQTGSVFGSGREADAS